RLEKSVVLTLDGRTSSSLILAPGTVPDDFSIDLAADASLRPGDSLKVTVSFTPTALGSQSGDIVIHATNTKEGLITLHVTGVGQKYAIQTDPVELDFGTVLLGTRKTLPLVVTNLVDVSDDITVFSDDPAFTVDQDLVSLPGSGASTIQVT